MPSENENIEAKLCSYVEGDLDPAGRAEIEKYLGANPQYRSLIADLARSRGLLRALPRESAPAELLETLQGQLERSTLLGDDDRGASDMRISRWPQMTAWAAVLLLTGGLAAVIYRVLPSSNKQPELALLHSLPVDAPTPTGAGMPLADKRAEAMDGLKSATNIPPITPPATDDKFTIAAKPVAAAPAAPVEDKLAMAKEGQSNITNSTALPPGSVSNIATNGNFTGSISTSNTSVPERKLLATMLGSSGGEHQANESGPRGRNLYLVVHARDAESANGQVAAYLNNNGIAYQAVNGPAASLTLQTSAQQMSTTTVTFAGTAMSSSAKSQFDRVAPLMSAARPAPAAATTQPAGETASTGERYGMVQSKAAAVPPADQMADMRRRDVGQYQQQAGQMEEQRMDVSGGATQKQVSEPENSTPSQQSAASLTAGANNVIIARNLTLRQAQSLSDSLAQQKSDVSPFYPVTGEVAPAAAQAQAAAPTTAPIADQAKKLDADRLAAGDTVRIVAQDNGLKGVEAMDETQTVDAEGNINLPLVGKLKAADHSETDLQESIAHAYRDAKSPTDATWSIHRLSRAPAATTAPAKDEVAASTQPPAANAADDSQRVDLTILVYGQPADATQPTTQATAPPVLEAAPTTEPAAAPTTLPAK